MHTPLIVACGIVAALVACHDPLPVEGHLLVWIDTDAPLPADGEDVAVLPALLDSVRIEIASEDGELACADCRRELSLSERRIEEGASFTVIARSATHLRAVAFRERSEAASPEAAVHVFLRLPAPQRFGAIDVTVRFPLAELGAPAPVIPVDAPLGRPARPRAISALAQRKPCTGTPPSGAVCVPGGAFWMGSPEDLVFEWFTPPRVVALSPFFLDAHEVTVREFREGGGDASGVIAHSGSALGTHASDFCTFTPEPGPFEDHPIDCVNWSAARAFCLARGGDLPSEARYEYAASGRVGRRFPWGLERPACADAVLGRGPRSELFSDLGGAHNRDCLPDASLGRYASLGFFRPAIREDIGRDVVTFDGGRIQDLLGNLLEWTLDGFEPRSGACWSASRIASDPVCSPDDREHAVRGGSWADAPSTVSVWMRNSGPSGGPFAAFRVGFRCAYPDRP